MTIFYKTGIYAQDINCKDVITLLGYSVPCEKCPYGDCISSLKPVEKQLILRHNLIKTAFMYYNMGMTLTKIASLLPIQKNRLKYYINNRKKIEDKLKRFAPVII